MELLLEHQFDSIAIFTGGLSAEQYAAISTHLETGGNLLIAADSSLSPHTRKFLRSVGVGVEPNVSNLVDYESSLQLSDG